MKTIKDICNLSCVFLAPVCVSFDLILRSIVNKKVLSCIIYISLYLKNETNFKAELKSKTHYGV